MSIWGALAGGFAGTVVLTTILRAASEGGLTRMDLPFLLGTAFTGDRIRAKALGYGLHFVAGLIFALVYYAIFTAIDESGWWLGVLFGVVHALFAGTALVNILLPLVHPRMASALTAAPTVALLEPPGFMMRNYGMRTPLVSLIAHAAYGAIVGGFISLASRRGRQPLSARSECLARREPSPGGPASRLQNISTVSASGAARSAAGGAHASSSPLKEKTPEHTVAAQLPVHAKGGLLLERAESGAFRLRRGRGSARPAAYSLHVGPMRTCAGQVGAAGGLSPR